MLRKIRMQCLLIKQYRSADDKTDEGLDAVLEHHQNMQEKIAEEMIQMAQNLKHNSLVASNILKKDTQVII